MARFFKPITNGYQIYFDTWIKDNWPTYRIWREHVPFGPVVTGLIEDMQPNTTYWVRTKLFCGKTDSTAGFLISAAVTTFVDSKICTFIQNNNRYG